MALSRAWADPMPSDVVGLGQAKATCGEPPGGVYGESLHAQGDPSGDTVLSGSDG